MTNKTNKANNVRLRPVVASKIEASGGEPGREGTEGSPGGPRDDLPFDGGPDDDGGLDDVIDLH
jgi:hypothetical protein